MVKADLLSVLYSEINLPLLSRGEGGFGFLVSVNQFNCNTCKSFPLLTATREKMSENL